MRRWSAPVLVALLASCSHADGTSWSPAETISGISRRISAVHLSVGRGSASCEEGCPAGSHCQADTGSCRPSAAPHPAEDVAVVADLSPCRAAGCCTPAARWDAAACRRLPSGDAWGPFDPRQRRWIPMPAAATNLGSPAADAQPASAARTEPETDAETETAPSRTSTSAGLHPEAAAGLHPEAAAGLHPEAAAGLHPEAAAGLHPETAAGLHPEAAAGLHPEAAAGLHPEAAAGLHPEAAAGLHPEAAAGLHRAAPGLVAWGGPPDESADGTPAVRRLAPPELDFFAQAIDFEGIPIKASSSVAPIALRVVYRQLATMLAALPAARDNLRAAKVQLEVIGRGERIDELPDHRGWTHYPLDTRGDRFDPRGWGGLSGSCGEENLLALPSDRYRDHRPICLHELAHALYSFGLSEDWREQLRQQFLRSESRWEGAYAALNPEEFFAETTLWYFGARGDFGSLQPPPRPGRAWLRAHDPETFALLDGLYSGRAPVAKAPWVQLGAVGRPRRSGPATEPALLLLENRTVHPAEFFWLDPRGHEKRFGQIPAGDRRLISTFRGQTWIARDPGAHRQRAWVVDAPQAQAVFDVAPSDARG